MRDAQHWTFARGGRVRNRPNKQHHRRLAAGAQSRQHAFCHSRRRRFGNDGNDFCFRVCCQQAYALQHGGAAHFFIDVAATSANSMADATAHAVDLGADFLQAGAKQVAAGYCVYGPQTMLVLTVGDGVVMFTLDREQGSFVLTQEHVKVPEDTQEFAINMSNMRHWAPPVKRYVDECLQGQDGVRGKNFNMRWIASMVADVHRILMRGGVFMYPWDQREPNKPGKLRLMYEANPMSWLIEQAGGASTNGHQRILDIQPTQLHERVSVILGSKNEVERVTAYHAQV